jgi:FtsZ-interacting cell division protein ZipA
LLAESKQATLNAIQTFNTPLATYKTETFIVLMVIAWRSLLHAYYRSRRNDYRYFDQKPQRRSFSRTKSGAYRYWELERCLNDESVSARRPNKEQPSLPDWAQA